MDILFLDILESMLIARYASATRKVAFLDESIAKIDKLKFFAEIAWENKLLTDKSYSEFLQQLMEVGRELGGWKKGLVIKTPPLKF